MKKILTEERMKGVCLVFLAKTTILVQGRNGKASMSLQELNYYYK